MGQVVQRTFATVGRNFAVFSLLALLLAGLPAALTGGLLTLVAGAAAAGQPVDPGNGAALAAGAGVFVLSAIVSIVATYILQGAITYGVVADLNGRRAKFGECVSTGLRQAGWLFLLALVVGLAEAFGFILLIVPGLMMATAWIVAVPSQVVERTGVFGAMSRSADLTRGHRWAIFGLMVIFVIGSSMVQGALIAVLGAIAATSTTNAQVVQQVFLQPLVTSFTTLVGAAGVASIYYELRAARESVGPEALAAVFD